MMPKADVMALWKRIPESTRNRREMDYTMRNLLGEMPCCLPVYHSHWRYLNDMVDAFGGNGPYMFLENKVERVYDFFEKLIVVPGKKDGEYKPFVLLDWHLFPTANLYGFYHREPHRSGRIIRKFTTVAATTPRRGAKSSLFGGYHIYEIFFVGFDNQVGAISGSTEEQGKKTMRLMSQMVNFSPNLGHILKYRDTANLVRLELSEKVPGDNSYIDVLPFSPNATGHKGDALAVAHFEEFAQHPNGSMKTAIQNATLDHPNPLRLISTNPGRPFTPAHEEYKLQNRIVNPDDSYTAGHYFAVNYGMDKGDDAINDRKIWYKANPGLPVTPEESNIAEQAVECKGSPAKIRDFEHDICGRWILDWGNQERWRSWDDFEPMVMPREKFDEKFTYDVLKGYPLTLSADFADKRDFAVILLNWDLTTHPDYSERCEEEGIGMNVIDFATWIPERTIEDKIRTTGYAFTEWIDQGYLTVTPNAMTTSWGQIADFLVRLKETYKLGTIISDDNYIDPLTRELKDRNLTMERYNMAADFTVIGHGQGHIQGLNQEKKWGNRLYMGHSISWADEKLDRGEFIFRENPLFELAVEYLIPIKDGKDNLAFTKDRNDPACYNDHGICFVMECGHIEYLKMAPSPVGWNRRAIRERIKTRDKNAATLANR